MVRRSTKKLVAMIVAFAMIVAQNGSVFAAEAATVSQGQTAEVELTVSPDQAEDVSTVSDQKAEETGSVSEGKAAEEGIDDTTTAADSEVSESSVSDNTEEAVSANGSESGILSLGLSGMPDSYVLSDGLSWEKEQLKAHDVVNELKELKAGVDYIENQVIFTADDEEFAKQVAASYNAKLVSCKNGVAVLELDPEKITVSQAVEAGCSELMSNMVPVNPNYLIYLDDPEVDRSSLESSSSREEAAGISASKKTGMTLDWSYWYYTGFKDKYLNPWVEPDPIYYQWMHDAIGSYQAWGVSTGSSDVTVAVIDTGVNEKSSDLKGRVSTIPDWPTTYSSDGNSYDIGDNSSHGTHVAGIIAAAGGNGKGGVGIAPNVKILNVPVFLLIPSTGGYISGAPSDLIIQGLNYIKNNKAAQVINMSLGMTSYSSIYDAAIKGVYEAGITICASRGNDGNTLFNYPACMDGVIGVASVDNEGNRSSFSSYGLFTDISAPGTNILSTINGSSETNPDQHNDDWGLMSGTSMASPVVAGVCALYISATGITNPDMILKAMQKSATKCSSSGMGAGIVNVAAMLPDDSEKPGITAYKKDGKEENMSSLSSDSVLRFTTPSSAKGGTIAYVFTFDGSDPKAENGMVTNGIELSMGDSDYNVSDLLDKGMAVGKPVTIKAIRISAKGTASEIYTGSITVSGTTETQAKGVIISGPSKVAAGKSVKYTASCKPAYVDSAFKWEVRDNPQGVTINKKTGKLSVKKGVSGSFKVVAAADDAGSKEGVLSVTITDPASAVTVTASATDEDVNIPVTKNGSLKSVRMYTADCVHTSSQKENTLKLTAKADNNAGIIFKSSKKAVATVDDEGNITARRAGNTVITCMADDGSGKKSTVKVKVIVPASEVRMNTKNNQATIVYGKSMKINAKPGNTYGNPTIKKIAWSLEAVTGYDSSGATHDVTSQCGKLVTVNNGNIKVKKGIKDLGYNFYSFKVKAKSTDGTGVWREMTKYITPPATIYKTTYKRIICAKQVSGKIYFYTESGRELYDIEQVRVKPIITTSNPKVAGASLGTVETAQSDGVKLMYWPLIISTGSKSGKAVLTIDPNDGSNKKIKVSVTVK